MEVCYTLLENGLEFIITALEYLDDDNQMDKKRVIKHSLLNLSSGIELVFKQRLYNENWTYIFADMNKSKRPQLLTGDFKSVDSQSNIERLSNLCDIVFSKEELNILENLRLKRNKIEHFAISDTIDAVKSITIKALQIVFDFLHKYFNEDDFTEKETEMLEEIRDKVLKINQFIGVRLEQIALTEGEKDNGRLDFINCPVCLQPTLKHDNEVNCLFCFYTASANKAAEEYVFNVLREDKYSCIKDGGEYPVYECCDCSENSLVNDYLNDRYICFNCGVEYKQSEIAFCSECGRAYNEDEDDIGICNDCIEYKLDEDD